MKIIRNSARCALCNDHIESVYRHDFVSCICGEISIDGGKDYLKSSARNVNNIIDTSIVESEDDEIESNQTM